MNAEDKKRVTEHFRAVMNHTASADRPIEGTSDINLTPRAILEKNISSGKLFTALDDYLKSSGRTLDDVLAQNSPKGPGLH